MSCVPFLNHIKKACLLHFVTWIACLILPSDLWNFKNIAAVFCEVCLYVHVCEGSAVAGFHLGNMCTWLWSLGNNDWFQVPGILALGGVCSWQCAGNWQCDWIPYFGSNCPGFAELCGLHHNTQQPYSNITLRQVFHFLIVYTMHKLFKTLWYCDQLCSMMHCGDIMCYEMVEQFCSKLNNASLLCVSCFIVLLCCSLHKHRCAPVFLIGIWTHYKVLPSLHHLSASEWLTGSTGFLSTTEYSLKSLHLPIRP